MDYLETQANKLRSKLQKDLKEIDFHNKQLDKDIEDVRKFQSVMEAAGFKFIFVVFDEHDYRALSAMFTSSLKTMDGKSAINPKTPQEAVVEGLKKLGYATIKTHSSKELTFNSGDKTVTLSKTQHGFECKLNFDY